jgi:hypothetical protein
VRCVDRPLIRLALVAVGLMALLDIAIRAPLDPSKMLQIALSAALALGIGVLAWSIHRTESHNAEAALSPQD